MDLLWRIGSRWCGWRFFAILLMLIPVPVVLYFDRSLYNTYWIPKNFVTFIGLLALFLVVWAGRVSSPLLRSRTFRNPVVLCVLVFQAAIVLSSLFSMNGWISFYGSYWRQFGVIVVVPLTAVVVLGVFLFRDRRDLERLCLFAAVGCAAYAAVGLLQRAGFQVRGIEILYSRSSGFEGNPDFYGPTMLLLTVPTFALAAGAFLRRKYFAGALLAVSSILGVAAIFSSMTRATWIGLAASLACFGFLVFLSFWRKHWKLLLAMALLLALACPVLFLSIARLGIPLPETHEDAFDKLRSIMTLKEKSGMTNQRVFLWRDTLRYSGSLLRQGHVLGAGWEVFHRPFMRFKSLELAQITRRINYDNPHNHYLELLAKTGIPGLAAFVAILLVISWGSFRYLVKFHGRMRKTITVIGAFSAVFGYAVNLIAIFPTVVSYLIFFLFLAALAPTLFPGRRIGAASAVSEVSLPSRRRPWRRLPVVAANLYFLLLVALSAAGIQYCLRIVDADRHFETGRKIMAKKDVSEDEVDHALSEFDRALQTNYRETFYLNQLIRAMGVKSNRLTRRDKFEDADLLYQKSLILAERYYATTWTPDILFMTLGINAYTIGYINDAIAHFEKALAFDPLNYHIHSVLSSMFSFVYPLSEDEGDLKRAFGHAYFSSCVILRHFPYCDPAAMRATLEIGNQIYEKNQDPVLLEKLMDALTVFALNMRDPRQLKRTVDALSKTTYGKTARAASVCYEYSQVARDSALDEKVRAGKLDALQKKMEAFALNDRHYLRMKKEMEDMRNSP